MSEILVVAARRGVYTNERASALAGVPRSTMYLWARRSILAPSVSSQKLKLWSWADLVALRAIYWLRHPASDEDRRPTPMPVVRRLISEVAYQAGELGEAIVSATLVLHADRRGTPYMEIGERIIEGRHAWKQQAGRELVIDLLSAFSVESRLHGPDLVRPRDGLRIIPGKLTGEPHIQDTRIETRVSWALNRRGFSTEQLLDFYSDLSPATLASALDLERQLERNASAA